MPGTLHRLDRDGTHRAQFDKNKKKIYKTQNVCGICGQPVDMSLKFPNPMSKSIDHIIPIVRGGHPSDIDNLQLAHLSCNRAKSDGVSGVGSSNTKGKSTQNTQNNGILPNRILPQSIDWQNYKA